MRFNSLISCCTGIFLLSSAAALADVPDSVNCQGILVDSVGDPVTTTVSVTFSIFDEENGGNPLWAEEQEVTPDSQGRFEVYLGGGTPAGLYSMNPGVFKESNRWLEIEIDGYSPMPRIPFTVTPYAYRVATVDGSTGGRISGYVNISGDLGVGTDLPQAKLHIGGTPGVDGLMFPDSTLQTTAASGPPTANLWTLSLTPSTGTTTYTNITGSDIFITSVNVTGATIAGYVEWNVASTIFRFRMPANGSYLWTGGGVPIPLSDGESMTLMASEFTRVTFVGFTE